MEDTLRLISSKVSQGRPIVTTVAKDFFGRTISPGMMIAAASGTWSKKHVLRVGIVTKITPTGKVSLKTVDGSVNTIWHSKNVLILV